MHRARWLAAGIAAVQFFVIAGTVQAQAPAPDDSRPAPVPGPAQPPRPGAPTPTPPTKEAEPEPLPPAETVQPPQRVPEDLLRSPEPTTVAPRVFIGPDLFNPPAHQGWLSLTPSFTLSGEYNDNIFLASRTVRSDWIIGFTPGLTLSIQRPNYRVLAGYHVSGEVFLKETDLTNFGKSQNFFADAFYQISPTVRFSLSDQFVFSRDSNSLTSAGVSVGRESAWRNTITPSVRWQATPNTGLSLTGSHTILQFDKTNDRDSNTYRVVLGADHRLTQRLTGYADMGVGYLDVSGEPSAWTYTPTVGLGYDVTPTLRASISGGPTIVDSSGDTTISPSITASLTQAFKLGYLQAGYNRAVTAETIGASDSQTVFASLIVSKLLRGLQLSFTPRYSVVDPDVSGRNRGSSDVKTLTLNLGATYQIARNISLIGAYTFFQQTTDGSGGDVDQNRVYLGVQYAFPINFY